MSEVSMKAHTKCARCGEHHRLDQYRAGDRVRVVLEPTNPYHHGASELIGRVGIVHSWSQYGQDQPLSVRVRFDGIESHMDPVFMPCELTPSFSAQDQLLAAGDLIHEALMMLIKNRITCSCCGSDELCAVTLLDLLRRFPVHTWPTEAELDAAGVTGFFEGTYVIGGVTKTSGAYNRVVVAIRERRLP